MNFWSISSCFIFAARPASAPPNAFHVKTWSSGSIAMCWSSFTLPSSSAAVTNTSPKVRGSTNRRSPPWANVKTTCVCCASGTRLVPGRTARSSRSATTNTSPLSMCSRTYLPRRSTFVNLRPTTRSVNSLRLPCRRITRIAFFEERTSAAVDLATDDVLLEVASHHLDFGKFHLRPLRPRRLGVAGARAFVSRRKASCAACCSASFFERPDPRPPRRARRGTPSR